MDNTVEINFDDWKSATITREELKNTDSIFDLFKDKGVPINDDSYLRMGEYIKDEDRWVYRWIKKQMVVDLGD